MKRSVGLGEFKTMSEIGGLFHDELKEAVQPHGIKLRACPWKSGKAAASAAGASDETGSNTVTTLTPNGVVTTTVVTAHFAANGVRVDTMLKGTDGSEWKVVASGRTHVSLQPKLGARAKRPREIGVNTLLTTSKVSTGIEKDPPSPRLI